MVVVLPENSCDAWLRATPGQQMEFMRPIRAADLQAIAVESATAPVKQAFDAGVNFIDTANVYSVGQSETLTGNAIKSLGLPRDELVVATKATGDMNETAVNSRRQSRYHLMNELDACLKRLQLEPHRPVPTAQL